MATPFSARLSAILKSRGMSQTDLAAVSGLTPSAINRYVNGNRVPSIEVTERICAALGVGPEVLPSVAHVRAVAMVLSGLNVTAIALRAARQPPCPSSRAAASLAASVEPWALPKVPRLLSRPRGSKAPWESPS